MKKIISFSLWGNEPLYINGAISNIINSQKFYPGWICRFYIDESIDKDLQEKILSFGNTEIKIMPKAEDVLGMFWRFAPMWDDLEIERFIVRDTDCQPTKREVNAVNEWITSEKPFHIIRDNHYHYVPILGGTWGAIPGCIPNMQKDISEFLLTVQETKSQHKSRKFHGVDQIFLYNFVWPIIKDNHIAHIRENEPVLVMTGKEIILPPLEEGGHFIGMPCTDINGQCTRVESHLLKSNSMLYKRICLMVPTYKRIDRIGSFISSVYDTVSNIENVCFSFCVNINDKETREFLNSYNWHNKECFEIIDEDTIQPNLSLYFNKMYKETKFQDAIVSMLGDDMIFKTKDWDLRILDIINKHDGKAIVYCDDNFTAHASCAVNLFTARKEIVELTKKPFMCEYFHADMIDAIWTMVGMMTGTIHYLSDVIIQHNHSSAQSAEFWDDTFKRLNPIQKVCSTKENMKLATTYATLCAKNLIENGVGHWNILQ